jgi:hypothetical protein
MKLVNIDADLSPLLQYSGRNLRNIARGCPEELQVNSVMETTMKNAVLHKAVEKHYKCARSIHFDLRLLIR